MASFQRRTCLGLLAVAMFVVTIVESADPDPLVDFLPNATSFTLRNIFKNGVVSHDSGGVRTSTSIANFPALTSQGLAIVMFKMVPCGSNLPHTHPRATEVLSLISGGPLQVGFVDTAGKAHNDIMYPGDVTVFPRGTMHFELNVGTEEAFYLSALNSQNPGTLTTSEAIFALPRRAVATAFNTDLRTIRRVNSTLPPYSISLKLVPQSGCVPGKDITTDF